ncbi:MAG: PQQ-binding-like beta-propeller repeat protein, partial [Euryarchaeota archaeon]|nr:PQQ-binding-like beta-propeller repeat protein [Euryarchaeota archaeon]
VNPNGTLQWQFGAGQFKGNPSIAEDGTIYVPSFDGYLYAIFPNGTMKWRASTGDSVAGAGVALTSDGTIYIGTDLLRAYYPNGTLKWSTDVQDDIYGTVPAVSADGTIFVSAGLSIVAVNSDGTKRWKHQIADTHAYSSPSIGADGTVYVGSTWGGVWSYGFLHAFGLGPLRAEAGGPYNGAMTEPLQFNGDAFGGAPPYTYYWDFGDSYASEDQNPTHTYAHRGNYTAVLTVTDYTNNQSNDTTQVEIGYPLPKITILKPVNALYIFNMKICNLPAPIIIGRITIIANVTQVDAAIDRVEFYYSGDLQYTDTSPPYQWVWKGHPPPFDQDFLVRAYDTVGNRNDKMIYITKIF